MPGAASSGPAGIVSAAAAATAAERVTSAFEVARRCLREEGVSRGSFRLLAIDHTHVIRQDGELS